MSDYNDQSSEELLHQLDVVVALALNQLVQPKLLTDPSSIMGMVLVSQLGQI